MALHRAWFAAAGVIAFLWGPLSCGDSQSNPGFSSDTNGAASSGASPATGASGSSGAGQTSRASGTTSTNAGSGSGGADGGSSNSGSNAGGGGTDSGGVRASSGNDGSGSGGGDGGNLGNGSGGPSGGSGSGISTSSGSSSGDSNRGGSSSSGSSSNSSSSGSSNCTTPPPPSELVGWATVSGSTTGGASGPTVTVSTLSALKTAVAGSSPEVVEVTGMIDTGTGGLNVGSNKTIVGLCGATIHGHIQMTGSSNVIVRNLTIVGYNCASPDTTSCSSGLDAITVESGNQHLWFDHDDISDGSDGNLDITHAADLITISWTKFHYSGRRASGHQFCNLIGHSDTNAAEDSGHLRVTFHHDWWADNVDQRMPRVRFGLVHVFDSLYTASGDSVCIEAGVSCNIRDENNVFISVNNPIDLTHIDSASIVQSFGNIYMGTTGTQADVGAAAFTPPYPYTLDPAANVQADVMAMAGPQ